MKRREEKKEGVERKKLRSDEGRRRGVEKSRIGDERRVEERKRTKIKRRGGWEGKELEKKEGKERGLRSEGC